MKTDITKIEDLLKSNGKINNKLIYSDKFKSTPLYNDILEKTVFLNQFDGITITHRVLYIIGNVSIIYCPKCNLPRIYFKSLQQTFKLCNHHIITDNGKKLLKTKWGKITDKLLNEVNQHTNLILDKKTFNNVLETLSNKKPNYNFLITNKNFSFYHDLLIKTKDIVPIDKNDLCLSKRVYLISNNITEIPKCKICLTNDSIYVNSVIGFSNCCENENCKKLNHYSQLNKTLETKISQQCSTLIDSTKYELIHTPTTLNSDTLVIKCLKCGKISSWRINNGALSNLANIDLCKHCEHTSSKLENDVYTFIQSIYSGKVIHKIDSRKIIPPYELDIYIPDKKIAIEFDGLYWHSLKELDQSNKNYHLMKTEMCEKQGIQLIHIFEDEWIYKQDIVKSRLKNLLGIYDKTIFARKCEIKEVDSKISKQFQLDNHIQGATNSKVNLCLFFEDELISLMTFSKCRFDKKHEWELVRFCNKLGYHVIGAAGKLLKYFERNWKPKSLISYADRRWSQGKLYNVLGFNLDHISKPNYWYLDSNFSMRLERIKFQKHKLKKLLKTFDINNTELQNMVNNCYSRIYDCGNLVYVKIY